MGPAHRNISQRFAVDRFRLSQIFDVAGGFIKPERAPNQFVVVTGRMIITPRSRNGIDVVAAVAVGKVKSAFAWLRRFWEYGRSSPRKRMPAAASAAAASPAISEPGFSASILNAGRFIFMASGGPRTSDPTGDPLPAHKTRPLAHEPS